MIHQNPAYGTYTYSTTLNSGKDQINYVAANLWTYFAWDHRGNRTSDGPAWTNDKRSYTYDGRSNVRQITGKRRHPLTGVFHTYTITNAYDHKNRRVFKSYVWNGTTAHWFFYYDDEDRLIEVKHTPNIGSSSTYSIYQFYWLGGRAVAYWQTDYPSVTISRRYLHTDAKGRPLEAWSWPSSGAAAQVWAIDPDAFGWDRITVGSSIFQPLRAEGGRQFYESETLASDFQFVAFLIRPQLHVEHGRVYDPFVGQSLQSVESWAADSYNGAGSIPGMGSLFDGGQSGGLTERTRICRWELVTAYETPGGTIVLEERQVCVWGDNDTDGGGRDGNDDGRHGGTGGGYGGSGGDYTPPNTPRRPASIPPPEEERKWKVRQCIDTICYPQYELDVGRCKRLPIWKRPGCREQAMAKYIQCMKRCEELFPPVGGTEVLARDSLETRACAEVWLPQFAYLQ